MQFAAQGRDDGPEPRAQGHGAQDRVYGITTAGGSHTDDISKRQRQYIVTMLFRIAGFIVVALVPGISWPIKILLMVIVTVIPFFAVVRANGGPPPRTDPTNLLIGAPPGRQLNEGRPGLPKADGTLEDETLAGEAWESGGRSADSSIDDSVGRDPDEDAADAAGENDTDRPRRYDS